jgi:flagellar hook-length control protein FliK
MSALPIAPSSQPAAATQADPTSATPASDSQFGPILQAASASPAGAQRRNASQGTAPDRPKSGRPQDDGTVRGPDQSPARPDAGSTARRAGRTAAGQQPDPDAAAAAAAACAIAPAAQAHPDVAAPTDRGTAISIASSSAPAASSPMIDTSRAPANLAADAGPDARDAGAHTARSALQSVDSTKLQAGLDAPRAAELRPVPSFDGATAGEAARTAVQAADDGAGLDGGAGGAAADPSFGLAAALAGSPLAAGQGAQAVAQALSTVTAASSLADGTASHPGTRSAAIAADPGSPGVAASGAFGTVGSYSPDTRASVATPVGQPGFAQEFAGRVLVLTHGGVQTAQISLEPAGLGPVGVSIQVHGHEATLAFTAAHPATRDALEAALPRLREMFASSGMQLSDASVGGRAQSDWSGSGNSRPAQWQRAEHGPDAAAGPADPMAATARTATVRLVDTYA